MKIALICPNYPPSANEGGVSHYTQKLARSLGDLGDEIIVVTDEQYLGTGYDGNIAVHKVPERWNLQTVGKISSKLHSRSIEIINLQYTPSMYTDDFKLAWRCLAQQFVSTISFHTLWGGSKLNHLFALNLLNKTNGIIATNSEIVYLLKKYLPFFLKKARHIPIGSNIEQKFLDENNLIKISNKYLNSSNMPIFVYFGMVYPGKGMGILIKAAHILKSKHNLDFKLLIVGGGNSDLFEYIQKKRKLVHALNLENNVFFTGKIPGEEVSALLSSSTAVILPFTSGVSDRRGSLMAALAHHKAVVTTRPAIPVDAFKNGENMVWPERVTAETLAEKIKHVLQNKIYRSKLENGARELSRKYCWKNIAEKTQDFFQMLISNKTSAKFDPAGRKSQPPLCNF